ncbi:MAG: hypothetical protein LBC28_03350 [Oscillospiraceae bacterium]|nr:hypothetical protein [Oscillospiraceae bacterium]
MNDELSRADIIRYFEEINRRLEAIGKRGELILAGGAAMSLVYNARDATQDIDALFAPKSDLRAIIADIARENGLRPDWLNDGVKGFFTKEMTFSEVLTYPHLSVYSMDAESLLAMKLTSARPYEKDLDDSIVLMRALNIQTEEQLLDVIEKYIEKSRQTPQARFFAMQAFSEYREQLEKENTTEKGPQL